MVSADRERHTESTCSARNDRKRGSLVRQKEDTTKEVACAERLESRIYRTPTQQGLMELSTSVKTNTHSGVFSDANHIEERRHQAIDIRELYGAVLGLAS